jgi:hypothetical protein
MFLLQFPNILVQQTEKGSQRTGCSRERNGLTEGRLAITFTRRLGCQALILTFQILRFYSALADEGANVFDYRGPAACRP